MEDVRTLVAVGSVLLFALASTSLEKRWVSMPMAMIVLGFIAGSDGIGLIDLNVQSETVKVAAELTLALMLFHDAVRIDLRAMRGSFALPVRLLGVGLPVMIALGIVGGLGVLPSLGLVGAALVATMLAPTDAALGEAVVTDKRVPGSIRQGLNVESGLNDGLSVPIFLVLLAAAVDPGALETGALARELMRQIGFGALGGLLMGGVGGLAFKWAAAHVTMAEEWRRIAILSISIGCFVAAAVMGGSGFIGAFVGGLLFGLASEARSPIDNALTGQLGAFFDAVSFLLVGAMLLPLALPHLGWQEVLYAALSLTVLRMASVAVAMLGSGARLPTVAFMGWFGPRGLATVVFTVLLLEESVPNGDQIAAVAVACIVMSAFAHGITAPPLVAAYARWLEASGPRDDAAVENREVAPQQPRRIRLREE